MALGDPYASPEQYRATVVKTDTGDDPDLIRDLAALSRYIDRSLGRTMGFSKDDSATARLYLPRSGRPIRLDWAESENPWRYGGVSRTLDIDDLVSVTSIQIDSQVDNTFATTLTTNDYELLPRNAAHLPEVEPYRQIELTTWGSQWAWPRNARVKVTGVFGWPAIPTVIVSATIELCAIWRLESDRAGGRMRELDTVLNVSSRAQGILDDLMRHYMSPAVLV